jgi:hypothetical protein
VTDPNLGVDVNLVAGGLDRTAKGDILRVHLGQSPDILQLRVEPRVLDRLDNTLADKHPPHTGIGDRLVARLLRVSPGLDVLRTHKLESSGLGEKVLIPLRDGRKVLEVLHHIQAGRNVVGALEKVEKVLGLEDHVRVDPHHRIVLNRSLKGLLVRTLEDIPTEALGSSEMYDRGVLLRNHNLMPSCRSLHEEIRPGQKKLTIIRLSRETEHELHM